MKCWGANDDGQLGRGASGSGVTPISVILRASGTPRDLALAGGQRNYAGKPVVTLGS